MASAMVFDSRHTHAGNGSAACVARSQFSGQARKNHANASDSNAGTDPNYPWKTMGKAASASALPPAARRGSRSEADLLAAIDEHVRCQLESTGDAPRRSHEHAVLPRRIGA